MPIGFGRLLLSAMRPNKQKCAYQQVQFVNHDVLGFAKLSQPTLTAIQNISSASLHNSDSVLHNLNMTIS